MKILFLSDFVPDPKLILNRSFIALLNDADKIVFNLEGSPLTGSDLDNRSQIMPINCDELIAFLEAFGKERFVIALANNHILDNGSVGLEFLIQQLKEYNVPFFGTKEKPFIIIEEEVVILNFVTAETVAKYAGKDHLNYLFYNTKQIREQIIEIEQLPNKPILYPHWGRDMDTTVFKTYNLGFDKNRWFVFGHHPHVISGVGDRVIYSMGNTFIPHPYYYKNYPSVRYGLAIMYDSDTETYSKLLTKVITSDNYVKNFELTCEDFEKIPTEVLDNEKHFSSLKRVFLNLFAFDGTLIDFFRLSALQMISGAFRLKIKYMKKKGYE
ncbi:CapA family protein [Pedobacter insulae]|uniref:Capsule synthesis protein PGA_cap n=1 Tax=Pedobacter insulae TaxID=414048 RepID=A0A1I2TJJ0_9SPHI|nr:CapA family protein [Pedobacter insulae]SFG62666.1 capsule synthesis protein PGA_cap [Pedobacter insulae]